MILSDVSVKRPVFATVLSLLLLAFGILSFSSLPVRQYPDISPPVVSIQANYRGAAANIIETKITQVIENAISGIEGIRSISSSSRDGRASISVEFSLDREMDDAANDIRDRVARIVARLPEEADPPTIAKRDADAQVIQWFNLSSPTMDPMKLTDYASRYIVDQFSVVDGVAQVQNSGAGRYAMRVWINRIALAARNLTVADIENALRRENVELPAGRIDSQNREFSVRITRSYNTVADFKAMPVRRGPDGHLIRLGEVAEIEIGPADYRNEFRTNMAPMVGLGIIKQSTANTLSVGLATKAQAELLNQTLPEGMNIQASFDSSIFIDAAINSVYRTLFITMILVSAVIYLFLGNFRATLVPAVTVPVCLTASFIILAAFGFSVNLLTLLALVLAIGLVVDDSIVVLENIYRRIEDGEPPLLASYNGARQVAFAVISTTLVLIAVFVPIAFLQGNIGRVFAEIAFAIGAAVVFSSFLALTLSPMMCSKLLKEHASHSWLNNRIDRVFTRLGQAYHRGLEICLPHPVIFGAGIIIVLAGIFGLMREIPSEFTPQEDQGSFFTFVSAPEGASYEYMQGQLRQIEATVLPYLQSGEVVRVLTRVPGFGAADAVNSAVVIVNLASWDERDRSTQTVMRELAAKWAQIPGVRAFPRAGGGLGRRGGGAQVQFVLGGPTYEELADWRDLLISRAMAHGGFQRIDSDYKETKPQLVVEVDKDRAADLGVSIQNIGSTMQTMFAERRVTTYTEGGEEYDVILQAKEDDRATPDDLTNIYVRSEATGELIPLSNLTRVENRADAGSLNRYNRLRTITLSASLGPDLTLGEALYFLEGVVRDELPVTAHVDYKGESRDFKESSNELYYMFAMALLVVFLVLAAQFESFVHPFVIMLAVPLAVGGALLGLYVTGGSLNVYSQIGIIMLIGIAAKNGILIVEFANQLRDEGFEFEEAIIEASQIRLRPVMMTAVSTIMGAMPLILATGPGAASRITLGVVIFWGVSTATFLTLFIVPVFYRLLCRHSQSPGAVAARLARLQEAVSKRI